MSERPAADRVRGMIRVGGVRGVPIFVSPSWLVIGAILSFAYAPVIRDSVPSLSAATAQVAALGFAFAFALCIVAHECGHTVVSLALGHPVTRIVLFALGGVSELAEDPERPRDELLVSGAGPLVSLAIAGGAWAGAAAVPSNGLPGALFVLLAWSNLLIAAFNLLPGLPLDGGRLLRAALAGCGMQPLRATVVAAWAGRVLAVAVAISSLYVERTTVGIAAGIVSLGLGAYLWFGAGVAIRAARLRARLPEIDVADLLRPGLFVPADVSVAEALRRAWEREVRGIVLLDSDENPTAIVDEARIEQVPAERRPWTPVSEVARPLADGVTLPVDIDAKAMLSLMRATPANEYLVLARDGSVAGIIATRDFARRLLGRP